MQGEVVPRDKEILRGIKRHSREARRLRCGRHVGREGRRQGVREGKGRKQGSERELSEVDEKNI